MTRALRGRLPDAAARAQFLRREGLIAIEWHKVAKVEIPTREGEPMISWNEDAMRA